MDFNKLLACRNRREKDFNSLHPLRLLVTASSMRSRLERRKCRLMNSVSQPLYPRAVSVDQALAFRYLLFIWLFYQRHVITLNKSIARCCRLNAPFITLEVSLHFNIDSMLWFSFAWQIAGYDAGHALCISSEMKIEKYAAAAFWTMHAIYTRDISSVETMSELRKLMQRLARKLPARCRDDAACKTAPEWNYLDKTLRACSNKTETRSRLWNLFIVSVIWSVLGARFGHRSAYRQRRLVHKICFCE